MKQAIKHSHFVVSLSKPTKQAVALAGVDA